MTTLATHMIQQNHRAAIASVDVDNHSGEIFAKTVKSWNCDVAIFLKMHREKPVKLTQVSDNMSLATVRDLLSEYVNIEFITHWAPAFQYEPHIERIQ